MSRRSKAASRLQRQLMQGADLRLPHSWFPAARRMRRRVICHLGPTNSGKTYSALQALRAAESGVYCGPLRLLAWEIYDQLNAGGVPCKLITGQEILSAASHQEAAGGGLVASSCLDPGKSLRLSPCLILKGRVELRIQQSKSSKFIWNY